MVLMIPAIIAAGVASGAITGYGVLAATGFGAAGIVAGEQNVYKFPIFLNRS